LYKYISVKKRKEKYGPSAQECNNDGAVGHMYVLCAGHEDGFKVRLGDGVLAFFKASKADFPGLSVWVVWVSNEVLKTVIKERAERGNSLREKSKRFQFIWRQGMKSVRKGVSVVGATDTVVNMNKDLGDCGEPKFMVGSGLIKERVGRSEEAMRKDFGNTLESCVSNGALGGVGEVREEDGVCDGNRMGGFEAFGNSDSELAKGNGNGRYRSIWDEGFHPAGVICYLCNCMRGPLSYVTMCISYSNCHVLW